VTIGQLRKQLRGIPDELAIVVRIPADEELNGNCFDIGAVSIEDNHATGEDFVAFDCNQGGES